MGYYEKKKHAKSVCHGYHHSDASNAGLHRTETLAEVGKRCDFRYKSGRETKIVSTVFYISIK